MVAICVKRNELKCNSAFLVRSVRFVFKSPFLVLITFYVSVV
jgi:hypothetical protein